MELEGDQKLVLYAVGALDTPLKTKIKLQKLFFLVTNVFKDMDNLFKFEAHLFGPYSETLDELSEELISLGLIEKNNAEFSLTPLGLEEYHSLTPNNELKKVINDFKEFLNDMTDDEVLIFIYAFYDDYISESIKWDSLKKYRVETALHLLENDKISFSKAVELSGKKYSDFQKIAIENNIRWRK